MICEYFRKCFEKNFYFLLIVDEMIFQGFEVLLVCFCLFDFIVDLFNLIKCEVLIDMCDLIRMIGLVIVIVIRNSLQKYVIDISNCCE